MTDADRPRPATIQYLSRYISSYWRGKQDLFISLCVIFIGLRALLLFLGGYTHPPALETGFSAILLTTLYVFIAHIGIGTWQTIGLIRCCDQYLKQGGAALLSYAIYLIIALGVVLTIVYVVFAYLTLFSDPSSGRKAWRPPPQQGPSYTLTIGAEAQTLTVSGQFAIGIAQKIETMIAQHNQIKTLILNSPGGHITEAFALARLIEKERLSVQVEMRCYSACTIAFVAGITRLLGPKGELGFHRFAMRDGYQNPYFNPREAEEQQRALYRRKGISNNFIARMFDTPHDQIWIPSREELRAAKILPN